VNIEKKLDFSSIDALYRPTKETMATIHEPESMKSSNNPNKVKKEKVTPTPA
jgi:hypothetical protein